MVLRERPAAVSRCSGSGLRQASHKAGVGYRFAMGKPTAGRGMKKSSAEYPGRPIAVGKELSRSGLQVCDGEANRRPGKRKNRTGS